MLEKKTLVTPASNSAARWLDGGSFIAGLSYLQGKQSGNDFFLKLYFETGSLSVTQTGLDLTMLSQISFNSWQASCLSLQSASINYRCKLLCLAFHAILSQCLVSRCISSKIPAEVFGLWLALWVSWGLLQTTAVPYPTLPFDFLLPREPLSIM